MNPSLPSDAGSWDVTLTVGLVSYPDIPEIQVSFKITVTCQVTTLAWTTIPLSPTTIRVGIGSQSALIPFLVSKTPNCPKPVNFGILETLPSFLSLQNMANASGDVEVTGATNGDHGSYQLTLTASVDLLNLSEQFTVEIINPCSEAVFET